MLLDVAHPRAGQAGAVRKVQLLHDGEPLQQVAEPRIRDVTLRPQRLHDPCADDVVELRRCSAHSSAGCLRWIFWDRADRLELRVCSTCANMRRRSVLAAWRHGCAG